MAVRKNKYGRDEYELVLRLYVRRIRGSGS